MLSVLFVFWSLSSVADLPGCERLRSSSSFRYELPRLKLKFGEQCFSFSGPKAWNSLPSNLQELTNTDTFKKLSKTHLFKLAFGELAWLCWCTTGHCRCNWRIKWRNVMLCWLNAFTNSNQTYCSAFRQVAPSIQAILLLFSLWWTRQLSMPLDHFSSSHDYITLSSLNLIRNPESESGIRIRNPNPESGLSIR